MPDGVFGTAIESAGVGTLLFFRFSPKLNHFLGFRPDEDEEDEVDGREFSLWGLRRNKRCWIKLFRMSMTLKPTKLILSSSIDCTTFARTNCFGKIDSSLNEAAKDIHGAQADEIDVS